MTEPNPVDTDAAPYTEQNSDFVPDPTDAMGTLDTSGTAGGANEDINSVTPVFEAAKAQDLTAAADAVEEGDTSSVVLPTDSKTDPDASDDEDAVQRLKDAAAAAQEDPVPVEDPSLDASQEQADQASSQDATTTAAQVEGEQAAATGTGTAKVQSDDASQRLDEGTTDTTSTAKTSTKKKN